ncbi:MAG: TIGR03546 family protein [Nitrospirae bacterium]|nr:TIGR03546 family protein [Nitrospirota bacterium]NTW64905.1 TIGR03546 family protein [Nitrospirota bacterium]
MLKMIAKLLKVLNSDADPSQISLALGFALISGLLPFFSPLSLLVLFVVFLLRVNLSAYFLGTAFFSGIAYALDPLLHRIGLALLTTGPLEGLWTTMYNTSVWRIQRLNNSVVMGGLAFGVLCFVPLVILSNALIRRYREHVLAWVRRTRLMQAITASTFYDIYKKASGWGWGGQS